MFEKRHLGGTQKFLLATGIVFGVFLALDSAAAKTALFSALVLFVKIFPILILVFLINLAINALVKPGTLQKHMGQDSGLLGYFYAVLSGILIGGPPYLLFPLLADFQKSGVRNAYLATFLFNRNVKIPYIPVMIYYFGLVYTVIISILLIIFSVLNGIIVEKLSSNQKPFDK